MPNGWAILNAAWSRRLFMCLVAISCAGGPSESELREWRQEAIAADKQAATVAAGHPDKSDRRAHELHVVGARGLAGQITLGWDELQHLPQTDVHTISPHQSSIAGTVYHYRGVAVSELLRRQGVETTAQNVTFVGYDGFRSTVTVNDLFKYPIIIATERNGRPIPRGEGGPLLLVFPYSAHPELASDYPDRWWVFYVSHLVIDTPPVELQVEGTRVDQAAFDALPRGQLWVTGRYRVNWPAQPVLIQGVFLRDILHYAGVSLSPSEQVSLIGLAPVHRDDTRPIRLSAAQLAKCDVLVGNRRGEEAERISAEFGGPLVMAYPPECAKELDDRSWMVHLQGIKRSP